MKNQKKKILVTQPALPDLEEFIPYLREIWDSKWLTNQGKFHQQLEKKLAEYLGVPYISLFTNGTLALVVSLQALRITEEVITSPYSFVATTHALWWNNIQPVFADIESDYLTLNPEKVEAAITPKTTAILPVHVYGNPSAMEELQEIADIHGLRIIYDAAHAFGVTYKDCSVMNWGDLSILSFHATKVFNTFEGGAIVSHDENMKKRIDYLKNFGFQQEDNVIGPGINAKMNEFQAALGLAQLKHHEENVTKRKKIHDLYKKQLGDVAGLSFSNIRENTSYNYAYFPVFIHENKYNKSRDELYNHLKTRGYYTRKYFYPLISNFPIYKGQPSAEPSNLPIASDIADKVLCLPIYPDLDHEYVRDICRIIKEFKS
ncbi:MAG: DegT/DnrJ/EryC1/StrS family aminotransferase [Bacteroidales bacterium]|nr:DegT/DnrJ/EryC1/StrS family aminotransferase [Bacteroidales bacterium]